MSVTLANAGSKTERPATDFYPTPREVTTAILDYLKLPRSSGIWEPACGEGNMVNVMRERGYEVQSGDILHGQDFLETTNCRVESDWIITNPPFYLAEKFIRRAFALNPRGFAFLLKSQYWHSSKRLALFDAIPPKAVLPLTWRPDFLFGSKSGSPTMEVLWTVWERGNKEETIYRPISRPRKASKTRKNSRELTI